jgi:hypothetical protein
MLRNEWNYADNDGKGRYKKRESWQILCDLWNSYDGYNLIHRLIILTQRFKIKGRFTRGRNNHKHT